VLQRFGESLQRIGNTDKEMQPHEAKYGTGWECHNAPRFPKFEPLNHVIGDTRGRPMVDGLARTQACPSSMTKTPLCLYALIDLVVRWGLRRPLMSISASTGEGSKQRFSFDQFCLQKTEKSYATFTVKKAGRCQTMLCSISPTPSINSRR
jgi:hypothetical protein